MDSLECQIMIVDENFECLWSLSWEQLHVLVWNVIGAATINGRNILYDNLTCILSDALFMWSHCRDSLLTAVLYSWAPLWSVHILYSNICHILLLYKAWGYYNKFDSVKPLLMLLMSQYTTMRVYGEWIKTYYVLCPNTYNNFGYVS